MASSSSSSSPSGAVALPPPTYSCGEYGRFRVPVSRPKPTATNKGATEQDHALTYASLVGPDGKCTNCGLADLPSDVFNRRMHFASCCYHELTKEDQHITSFRQAFTGRTGRNAMSTAVAAAGGGIASALAKQVGSKTPVNLKAEVVAYVAASGVSFSAVETRPFVSFVRALRPDIEERSMIGRAVVSRAMTPLREQVLKAIEEKLVEATGDKDFVRDVELEFTERAGAPSVRVRDRAARVLFSVTLDGWTNVAQKPYIGITLHFIDTSFKMRKFTIDISAFAHPHTGTRIIEAVDWALAQLGMQTKHMMGFTTDNGSNFLSAAKIVDILNFVCSCHTMHLALAGSIDSEVGEKLFKPVWDLLSTFARSSARRQALEKIERELQMPQLMPVYRVVTRWPSAKFSIDRYLVLEPAYRRLTAEMLGLKGDDAKEWAARKAAAAGAFEALLSAQKVLDKIQVINCRLQGSTEVTISRVLDAWAELINVTTFNSKEHHEGIEDWLDELCVDLAGRASDVAPRGHVRTKYLEAARFLDPTTGRAQFMNGHEAPAAPAPAAAKKGKASVAAMAAAAAAALATASTEEVAAEFTGIKDFLETMSELVLQGAAQAQQDAKPRGLVLASLSARHNMLDAELAIFVSLVSEKEKPANCLDWWSEHSMRMPNLAIIARSIFSIQASSAEAERLFSLAGIVMTVLRNRLGEAGAAQIICAAAYKEGLNLRDLYDAATAAHNEAKAAAKTAAKADADAAVEVEYVEASAAAGAGAGAGVGAGAAASSSASSSSSSSSASSGSRKRGRELSVSEERDADSGDAGAEHDALIDAGIISVDAKGLQLVDARAEAEAAADDGAYAAAREDEDSGTKYGPLIVSARSKRALRAPQRLDL